MAKAVELNLKEGDVAPEFTAATNGGGEISLSELRGRNVVLYFYPKDSTPGCTKQACGIRDRWNEFKEKGAVVLGVSTDSARSHDKFVDKFKLPFTLLVDDEKKIVNVYGVYGLRTFMGIPYMGTARVTFLIGPDGKIRKIWPNVKPEEHAAEVLATI